MIAYEEAKNMILKDRTGRVITASYRLPDGYLFLSVPNDLDEESIVFDGYDKVTFTGQLQEYSPVFNPEEFKQALKNRIE